jgi:hypothetical protein
MDWDSFDEEGAREDLGMQKCRACGAWCDGDLCGPACEEQLLFEEENAERFNQETEDERTDNTPREDS